MMIFYHDYFDFKKNKQHLFLYIFVRDDFVSNFPLDIEKNKQRRRLRRREREKKKKTYPKYCTVIIYHVFSGNNYYTVRMHFN